MSWDLHVVRLLRPPAPMAEMPGDSAPPPIGTRADVRRAIATGFPNASWGDPAWGRYDGDEFTLEFNVGQDETVKTFGISVFGGGDPATPLVRLSSAEGWFIIDCQSGEWLHHAADPSATWRAFQTFRDRTRSFLNSGPAAT